MKEIENYRLYKLTTMVGGNGQGIDTSDATATVEDIAIGKTAYANGKKLEGVAELKGEENAVINDSLVPTNTSTSNNSLLNKMIVKLPEEIDTSQWTSTANMFYSCENITKIPKMDTSNVVNMRSMFWYCSSIQTIPKLDTSKVTDMLGFIMYHSSLIEIPELDTSNVTTMQNAFYTNKVSSLTTIPELNGDKLINIAGILSNSYYKGNDKFINFGGIKNLGKAYTKTTKNYSDYAFSLYQCPNLTYKSLMNVINNLYDLNISYDVANGGTLYTQSLTLGSTNTAKLTAEEIAIATNKGWTVS